MPWKECNRMDERLRLVARLLDGENIAVVCRKARFSRANSVRFLSEDFINETSRKSASIMDQKPAH